MARAASADRVKMLFSLRVSNLPEAARDADILAAFGAYGEIGDYYRPTHHHLHSHRPSQYAFVRFTHPQAALAALRGLDNTLMHDQRISVSEANKQDSFFTQDTGFITNQEFDTPKIQTDDFDGSLPETHDEIRRRKWRREQETQFGVRVDDLSPDIAPEDLEGIFSSFGEVSSIYYPMDLKHMKPRGFAIVRYLREHEAQHAAGVMNGVNLGGGEGGGLGRNISASLIQQKTYYSLDESVVEQKVRRKKGVSYAFEL